MKYSLSHNTIVAIAIFTITVTYPLTTSAIPYTMYHALIKDTVAS